MRRSSSKSAVAALSLVAICGTIAIGFFSVPSIRSISNSHNEQSLALAGSDVNSYHIPPLSTSKSSQLRKPITNNRRLSKALPDGGCEITWPEKPPPGVQISYAASYPGCGARMTWNLVEALTGLWTGDDWNNNGRGSEVVTVKTHFPQSNGILVDFDEQIERGFIVIRNPMKSIPSFFNHIYEMRNHLPVHSERAPLEEWIKWRNAYLDTEISEYRKFISYWMDRYSPENRLLITYEGLTDDLIGAEVAKGLNEFLGQAEGVTAIDSDSVPCVWRAVVKNQPPPQQAAQMERLQAQALAAEQVELQGQGQPADALQAQQGQPVDAPGQPVDVFQQQQQPVDPFQAQQQGQPVDPFQAQQGQPVDPFQAQQQQPVDPFQQQQQQPFDAINNPNAPLYDSQAQPNAAAPSFEQQVAQAQAMDQQFGGAQAEGGAAPVDPAMLGAPPAGGVAPADPALLGAPPAGGVAPADPAMLGAPPAEGVAPADPALLGAPPAGGVAPADPAMLGAPPAEGVAPADPALLGAPPAGGVAPADPALLGAPPAEGAVPSLDQQLAESQLQLQQAQQYQVPAAGEQPVRHLQALEQELPALQQELPALQQQQPPAGDVQQEVRSLEAPTQLQEAQEPVQQTQQLGQDLASPSLVDQQLQAQQQGVRRRLDPGHHNSQRAGPEVPRPYEAEQLDKMMNMLLDVANKYGKDDVRLYHIMMGYYEKIREERVKMDPVDPGHSPPGGFY